MENKINKNNVWKMFDSISGKYDILNRLISMGLDKRWRKRVLSFIANDKPLKLLDLCTGTGDQIFAIAQKREKIKFVGVDLSNEMLKIAELKKTKLKRLQKISFMKADSSLLPFPDLAFDLITISFGIRNISNLNKCLEEMNRVLAKNGELFILEFSLPDNFFIKTIFLFYLTKVIPFIGKLICGDRLPYLYLGDTIKTFPYGQEFIKIIRLKQFKNVRAEKFLFGAVSLYHAIKK